VRQFHSSPPGAKLPSYATESINQSINQKWIKLCLKWRNTSINKSINQSINQKWIKLCLKWMNASTNKSINQSVGQLIRNLEWRFINGCFDLIIANGACVRFSWTGHVDSTRNCTTEESKRYGACISSHSSWFPGPFHQLSIYQRPG